MRSKKRHKNKRTRNFTQTRAIILEAAFMEFYKSGFQATSIDTIIEKTNLTKGALFHQFPTKLDLGYAVVNEVLINMIKERWIEPLNKYDNPLEGIKYLLKKNMGNQPQVQLNLGCPLNNLVQEMSNSDETFQIHLSNALDYWINGIDTHLKRGKKNGFIKKNIVTREVATFIVTLHEGFYGMIKGKRDKSIYKALEVALNQYIVQIIQKSAFD